MIEVFTVMRRPIRRDSCPSLTLNLPDDVLEHILNFIPPIQLCTSGWDCVSRGFSDMIEHRLSLCTSWSSRDEAFFFMPLLASADANQLSVKSLDKLLGVIVRRLFPHVSHLDIDVGVFAALENSLAKSEATFHGLSTLTIHLGDGCGNLHGVELMEGVNIFRRLFSNIREINLHLSLSESKDVTCCDTRHLSRFLKTCVQLADQPSWNVQLEDVTTIGQGWISPMELPASRDFVFVSYLRVLTETGIDICKLTLSDRRKISPYMLVMPNARRALYMYEEYKACEELTICYDIGLVAPMQFHQSDLHTSLKAVSLQSSHVLYKADFIGYLTNCPNLKTLRVILPDNWVRRTSRCKRGCFENADFSCFRESGWNSCQSLLPQAHIEIVCDCYDCEEQKAASE